MPFAVAAAAITYVASEKASKRAASAASTQLGFEQNKYNDWKDIYGDIEENLSDYYTSLTPETLAAAGLEAEAESFELAKTEITTRLAQRQISGGGLEADLLAKQEIGSAERRAEIRVEAEEDVRAQQTQFLRGGAVEKSRIEERQRALTDAAAQREREASKSAYQSTAKIIGAGAKYFGSQPSTGGAAPAIAAPTSPSAYETRQAANADFSATYDSGNGEFDAYDN